MSGVWCVDRTADRGEHAFLDRLDLPDREALIDLGRVRRMPARAMLFFEGDDATAVHLVRAGVVKLSANVAGHDVVLDLVGARDIVGELSAIDGHRRSATATVLTDAELITVGAADFTRYLVEHPLASLAMMRHVAGRLRRASQRQVQYGALDGTGRVCGRLVELMDRYGCDDSGAVVVDAPVSQSDIAAWAGLSREAVVKALHGLRRLGWVRTDAGTITVLDALAVRARAIG